MAYGTALASFNVEEFGVERVARLTSEEISERVAELRRVTHFDERPIALAASVATALAAVLACRKRARVGSRASIFTRDSAAEYG